MKVTIEAEPKEAAEFLSEFARLSHAHCQLGEERLATSIIQSMIPEKEKKKITTEEVPAGGYFQ